MPLSRKIFSSSSSSSSPFPSTPSSDHSNGSVGYSVHSKGQSVQQRRLTRQRKLRHLSDYDITGLHFKGTSSSPASPQSPKKSRSPGFSSEHWSSSAVPQPLPLPESPLTRKQESTSANSGHSPLGSPPVEHPGFAFGRNTVDQEAIPCTNSASNHRRSSCDNPTNESPKRYLSVNIPTNAFSAPVATQKSSAEDHCQSQVPANEDNSSYNVFGGFYRDAHSERIPNFRLHLAKSAPTSARSSPVTSPRRSSNVDIIDPLVPHDFHDNLVDHSSKLTLAKTAHSPDLSPLRSPGSYCPYPSSRIQEASPHHKLFSRVWSENNHFDAHPLPLPPKTSSPTQSSIHHQLASTQHFAENPSLTKGQWQKIKLIGRGTFGSVFHAINISTGASCAMKEVDIIPDDAKSVECVKQLEQEIKILRQLNHPNIVQYYGSEIVGDHLYIYMEYVHPGSINKFVREHCGAMTESVVRSFTRHILLGLAYLHSTKTIHRDIKGANLLVDASGVVKLADFGMAKILTGQSYDLSLKGSPYWMAPEVMKAALKKDDNPDLALAIDIWSLGCTIIEMLTGSPPWSEFEGHQAMFQVLHKIPPIPETLSPEGKDFLQQCFQRDPAQRPSAARLLEHAFVRNMQCQDVSVSPQLNPRVDPGDFPRSPSPRDAANHGRHPVPHSMGSRIFNKIQKLIGDTSQHCNAEESKHPMSYHHSPKRAELNVPRSASKPVTSNYMSVSNPSNIPLAFMTRNLLPAITCLFQTQQHPTCLYENHYAPLNSIRETVRKEEL